MKLILSLENPKGKVLCLYTVDSSLDWMKVTRDFSQELTVWPDWACHPCSISSKRACPTACRMLDFFCMLLEIGGYNKETKF